MRTYTHTKRTNKTHTHTHTNRLSFHSLVHSHFLHTGFSSFIVPLPPQLASSGKGSLQFTLVDCPGHASLIRTIIGRNRAVTHTHSHSSISPFRVCVCMCSYTLRVCGCARMCLCVPGGCALHLMLCVWCFSSHGGCSVFVCVCLCVHVCVYVRDDGKVSMYSH